MLSSCPSVLILRGYTLQATGLWKLPKFAPHWNMKTQQSSESGLFMHFYFLFLWEPLKHNEGTKAVCPVLTLRLSSVDDDSTSWRVVNCSLDTPEERALCLTQQHIRLFIDLQTLLTSIARTEYTHLLEKYNGSWRIKPFVLFKVAKSYRQPMITLWNLIFESELFKMG